VLCGFFVLGLVVYRTYMSHPPVPARVVDQNDSVLFTGNPCAVSWSGAVAAVRGLAGGRSGVTNRVNR
jgi:nitric oxide reductase large subunit